MSHRILSLILQICTLAKRIGDAGLKPGSISHPSDQEARCSAT